MRPILFQKYPHLEFEWDFEKNADIDVYSITPGSQKKVWWLCFETNCVFQCQHSFVATINHRALKDTGCPFCAKPAQKNCKHNSLAYLRPELMKEWDFEKNADIDVYSVTPGSHKKVGWVCRTPTCEQGCLHSWVSSIKSRALKASGCPYCKKGALKICYHNSLAYLRPDLLEQWDYEKNEKIDLSNVHVGSSKKMWWVCRVEKCVHSWKASINSRTRGGTGCPYCMTHPLNVCRHNSFAHLRPDLLKEWDWEKNENIDPYTIAIFSSKKMWWLCPTTTCAFFCKHSWKTAIVWRTSDRSTSCPYCAKQKRCEHNSFAYLRQDLLKEWDWEKNENIDPYSLALGTNQKCWWRCPRFTCTFECSHSWLASVNSRTNDKISVNSHGCPYCAKQKNCEHNSFAYLRPDLLKEWDWEKNENIDPYSLALGTNQKCWWICGENASHVWNVVVRSRTQGTGCPKCCRSRMEKLAIECLQEVSQEETEMDIREIDEEKRLFDYPHGRLRCDVYGRIIVPSLSSQQQFVIELDGEHHFD